MHTSSIVILLIILLWILHPVSLVVSLIIRFRKSIPVLNINKANSFKDWEKIRLYGIIAGIIILLYVIIILSIGWTFRWYIGLLIIQTILFLMLDRYLIAVNYSKRFWKNIPLPQQVDIRIAKFLSYFYVATRLTYITYCILPVPLISVLHFGYTIDTVVCTIHDSVKGKQEMLKRHTPFGTEINFIDNHDTLFSSMTYFDGKLIVWWNKDYCDNTYFFTTHLGLFIKYVNPHSLSIGCRIEPSEYEYDKDNNILYIDAPVIGENRSTIKYINNKFYLEYYRFYNVDTFNEDTSLTAPVIIEL